MKIDIMRMTIILILMASFFFVFVTISHSTGEDRMNAVQQDGLSINDIPQKKWDELAQKNIFFGHQSVGYNIITGIEQVLEEHPNIKLNIVKTTNADDINEPVFAHDWIGSNMNPESKTRAFVEVIQGGVGGKADISFMKMCYVDVTATTNVERVFQDYKQKMAKVESLFSDTVFIHVTVPLTAEPKGMKAVKQAGKNVIKKIIGKPIYRDNINRNKFNEMLKAEYAGKAPFFDLALLEATGLDGEPSGFIKDGEEIMTLANEYTDDGAHLNTVGSLRIAEQLLIYLANL